MGRARLPGGVNRTDVVRRALLALGPDEWLRTDRLGAVMGIEAGSVSEILCRQRRMTPGCLETRPSVERGRNGLPYGEWRISPGMRDVIARGGLAEHLAAATADGVQGAPKRKPAPFRFDALVECWPAALPPERMPESGRIVSLLWDR